MADEKVECPECNGSGCSWDGDEGGAYDCEICEGEGEVDKASL